MENKPAVKSQENKTPEIEQKKPALVHHKKTLIIIGLVVVVFIVLAAGLCFSFGLRLFRGSRKMAAYPELRAKSGRNFPGGRNFGNQFTNIGHNSGEVTKIDGNNLTVKTNDGKEISVQVSDTTSYYKNQNIAKQSDLKVGDKVRIFGRPDSNGVIQAQEIHIL